MRRGRRWKNALFFGVFVAIKPNFIDLEERHTHIRRERSSTMLLSVCEEMQENADVRRKEEETILVHDAHLHAEHIVVVVTRRRQAA